MITVPEVQLPLLDGHSADGASGPSTHSLYHHGNKMVRVAQRTDSHEEEDLENNEDSATTDSSDTTDLNDVSSVWEGKGGGGRSLVMVHGLTLTIVFCFSSQAHGSGITCPKQVLTCLSQIGLEIFAQTENKQTITCRKIYFTFGVKNHYLNIVFFVFGEKVLIHILSSETAISNLFYFFHGEEGMLDRFDWCLFVNFYQLWHMIFTCHAREVI